MAERQLSALPPAQPSYILRGHTSQIHSVRFVRQNSRLLSGDADGWVVCWKLETKRPIAVWKAHHGAILATEEWGRYNIITHGRDNSLRVWQLRPSDEPTLSTVLPAENATTSRPKPWLLHTLPVNTLNFCAFSMCYQQSFQITTTHNGPGTTEQSIVTTRESILVATPATDDKKINVYQLPEEKLKYVVPRTSTTDTGMVMAVKLLRHPVSQTVLVLSGYEGGLTAIHQLPCASNSSVRPAQLIYLSQPHTQPILSLDASPDARIYFTSSADAVVAGHHIPELTPVIDELDGESMQDEDSIKVGKGAGPATDSITRGESAAQETVAKQDILISPTQPSESLSFAKQSIPSLTSTTIPSSAGLSSLLSSTPAQTELRSSAPQRFPPATILPPYKTLNTKHAGQQSLRVRSDGRLFVTGGWDSRIRIYSARTLKEVAVLKWHKEGIYAVDFAQVLETGDLRSEDEIGRMAMTKETGLGRLQKQREETMQCKHWVAAGAKDGKISLWEVF